MEGIHSVDVSLIIGDVIYEELVSIAEEAGLDYTTGDEPSEFEMQEKEDKQVLALLRKKLDAVEPGSEADDAGVETMRQVEDMLAEPQEEEQQDTEEMPMMEAPVEEAPRGLMARG